MTSAGREHGTVAQGEGRQVAARRLPIGNIERTYLVIYLENPWKFLMWPSGEISATLTYPYYSKGDISIYLHIFAGKFYFIIYIRTPATENVETFLPTPDRSLY